MSKYSFEFKKNVVMSYLNGEGGFPTIAEKYNKNDCTIERDIRNLIAIKWEQSLKAKLSKYWIESEPPSCCKFIRIIKNYLVDQFV